MHACFGMYNVILVFSSCNTIAVLGSQEAKVLQPRMGGRRACPGCGFQTTLKCHRKDCGYDARDTDKRTVNGKRLAKQQVIKKMHPRQWLPHSTAAPVLGRDSSAFKNVTSANFMSPTDTPASPALRLFTADKCPPLEKYIEFLEQERRRLKKQVEDACRVKESMYARTRSIQRAHCELHAENMKFMHVVRIRTPSVP